MIPAAGAADAPTASIRGVLLHLMRMPLIRMPPIRMRTAFALAAASAAFLALAACGRAGPPLRPPSSDPAPVAVAPAPPSSSVDPSLAPGTAADTAAKTGFDAQGKPVATPGKKGSFILDPLLR